MSTPRTPFQSACPRDGSLHRKAAILIPARTFFSRTIATDWEHGLTVGNGTIGAVVFGSPADHEIVLSHERVVLPTDPIRAAPVLAPDLDTFRSLIAGGRAQEAADIAVERSREQGYPGLQWTDPLVPAAALSVLRPGDGDARDYRRIVDPETGLIEIRWTTRQGTTVLRSFVSRADGVCVVDLDGPIDEAERLVLHRPENAVTTTSGVKGGNEDHVAFAHECIGRSQVATMTFRAPWRFSPTGSQTILTPLGTRTNRLWVIDVAPSTAQGLLVDERIRRIETLPANFDRLLDAHRKRVGAEVVGSRLSLSAPTAPSSTEDLFDAEEPPARRQLIELQYSAAQATIAASTGELPPTLQGVWSGSYDPAWSSDYTMNGNVQNGSIAGMLSTGNHRLLRTYLDMLESMGDDFRQNAENLFGADGFVLPSRCSPTHGRTTHFNAQHCHEFWTAGGAWAASFFFDYVWYTGDLDYLRQHAYPFAREVERFYESFLVWNGDEIGFSPSYSPENTSPTFGSQASANATMDRAALHRLLVGLRRASGLLGLDSELDERRTGWLAGLPPYRIAPDGTLAEWLDEGVEERLGHRTSSQLLGLWFEPEPEFTRSPALISAVGALIDAKLAWRASAPGREEMAYGLVQLGLAAAAIGHGVAALECVERMSRLYFLESLSTTHDVGAIFNVDIAGGFPAVINAMLVSSSLQRLTLLPALPTEWPEGSVEGLRARGGIRIDRLSWDGEGIVVMVTALPGSVVVRGGARLEISVPTGFLATTGSSIAILDLAEGSTTTVEFTRAGSF